MTTSIKHSDRQFDRFDLRIIEELRADGRMTVTQLAERVGLSKTPCQVRLKRLLDCGAIRGFRALVDANMIGEGHIAFVEVKLSDTREAALNEFRTAVGKIQEIEECHMIAGHFDYLLKVRTKDISGYRDALGRKISTLPCVASTSSFVVMETLIEAGSPSKLKF